MLEKRSIKTFVLGALCMAFILVTPKVYSFVEEYILQPAQFNLYLNGKEYKGKDPILVYEGKTYIPLQTFAKELGLNLNWNNDANRVDINNVNFIGDNSLLHNSEPFGEGEVTINGLKVKFGRDDLLATEFVEIDNKKYISKAYIFQSIATNNKVYMFMRDSRPTDKFCITQDLYLKDILSNEIVVKNIPSVIFKNREFIGYDFYLEYIKDL